MRRFDTKKNIIHTTRTEQQLGGACCDDRQCSYNVWNSQCLNNVCQCNADFVNIGTHYCALKATVLGGPCSVNAQCMNIAGTSCDATGSCTCDAQNQFVSGMIIPAATGGSTDRRKRQAASMSLVTTMCMPAVGLRRPCMSNTQCSTMTNNSICVMGVCACASGFLPDSINATCQRKLKCRS